MVWAQVRKSDSIKELQGRMQSQADTSPTKIIKEVLHYNKYYQSQAMKDGLENEQLAIDKYTDLIHQQGHTRVHVAKCGFFVEKEKGILGVSPDGLVTDPSKRSPHGIIEAKNVIVKGPVLAIMLRAPLLLFWFSQERGVYC